MPDTEAVDGDVAVGRFHRFEGGNAHIIFEHDGKDIRVTVKEKDVLSTGSGADEVMEIKPDATILDVAWVNQKHHPTVRMPKKLMDEVVEAAGKTKIRLARP